MNLVGFLPRVEGPLVVELVEYLRNHENVIMAVDFGVWDFVGSSEDDDVPQVAIKSVRNTIPLDFVDAISRSRVPLKLVLVEGHNPRMEQLLAQSVLFAQLGVGVYVRNFGWVSLPNYRVHVEPEEIALAKSRGWSKGEDSVWRKRCKSCGEEKTPDDYYRTGRTTGNDPYRSVCKECDNARRATRA